MNYKSKLSHTGKLLFNQLYNDEIKKPNRGCIKNLIHKLFTSNYDLELERLEQAMYGSSLKLYESIFNHITIKECNKRAIYNIMILILTNGETTLTYQLVKYNLGFYLNLAVKAMKNQDHQTAILIKAAFESKHINTINIKYNKSMKKNLKLLTDTYGFYTEQYIPHLITAVKKFRHKYYIPSTFALDMVLNREFVKNKKYTVSTDINTSVNYKFFEICSEKHYQYKNTEFKLCPIYTENPLSLSITRIFVNKNIQDRDKQIDQIISKFSYLIKHQINIGKIDK